MFVWVILNRSNLGQEMKICTMYCKHSWGCEGCITVRLIMNNKIRQADLSAKKRFAEEFDTKFNCNYS